MKPTTTKEVPWVDAAIRYAHLQPNNNDDSTADEEEEEDDLPPPTESYTFSIPTQTTTMMDVIILI